MPVNINSEYYFCIAKNAKGETHWSAVVEDRYSLVYLDTGVEIESRWALDDLKKRGYTVTETKIFTEKLETVLDLVKV